MTANGELRGRTISAAVDGQSVELRMESGILHGAWIVVRVQWLSNARVMHRDHLFLVLTH